MDWYGPFIWAAFTMKTDKKADRTTPFRTVEMRLVYYKIIGTFEIELITYLTVSYVAMFKKIRININNFHLISAKSACRLLETSQHSVSRSTKDYWTSLTLSSISGGKTLAPALILFWVNVLQDSLLLS